MKIRMDKTLWFWVDVAYEHIKTDHESLTKRQLVPQILRQYEGCAGPTSSTIRARS
jgi:hypothetical protein